MAAHRCAGHIAFAVGQNPSGVGVPTNAGSLRTSGFDLYVQSGPLTLKADTVHGQSSSASQFAYNQLNAAAVAAGRLFPPYIGNLGTPEGADPNSLHAPGQTLVSLHIEGDIMKRLTASVDVTNLFATASPTAYQRNPYLIGPPGYTGNDALYARAYEHAAGSAQPYVLGNGVATDDGVHPSVPWTYGTAGYVPQGFPLARTVQFSLRYQL